MADTRPNTPWTRFAALPNTSPFKAVGMALIVALACAVVVSVTAVTLEPLQQANREAERQARIEAMVGQLPGLEDILADAGAESLAVRLVDLESGTLAEDADAANYDQGAAAADPETSIDVPADADIAGLGRIANRAPVYIVERDGELALLVLPVRGSGYQSMLYGYLALEGDLQTVAGLTFYEQGDTPGLGSRIQDPAWEALWPGTQIADPDGAIRIGVARGTASTPYEVDGISGATRTGAGVTALLQFWLGPHAFGPFLDRLRNGEIDL